MHWAFSNMRRPARGDACDGLRAGEEAEQLLIGPVVLLGVRAAAWARAVRDRFSTNHSCQAASALSQASSGWLSFLPVHFSSSSTARRLPLSRSIRPRRITWR